MSNEPLPARDELHCNPSCPYLLDFESDRGHFTCGLHGGTLGWDCSMTVPFLHPKCLTDLLTKKMSKPGEPKP